MRCEVAAVVELSISINIKHVHSTRWKPLFNFPIGCELLGVNS